MIKNVIFDIGNVLVKWSPREIITMTFGDDVNVDELMAILIHNQPFFDLNRGYFSLEKAKTLIKESTEYSQADIDHLFDNLFTSLTPIEGSFALLQRLHQAGYKLFSLTDNVHEVITYLQEKYEFWPYFYDAVVSADVGLLKPDPKIYEILIKQCQILPQESVFMDDMPANVLGAQKAGIHAFQFTTAEDAQQQLNAMGLVF